MRLPYASPLELAVQRFRPNILVEAADEAPFPEDGWVGCVLRIGGMRMRVDKRDGRCVIITIDPLTTESNPAILRAVARDRQGCLGVYGSTVEPGRVAVNDPVLIERRASLPSLCECVLLGEMTEVGCSRVAEVAAPGPLQRNGWQLVPAGEFQLSPRLLEWPGSGDVEMSRRRKFTWG
jgi:hypothetical protein